MAETTSFKNYINRAAITQLGECVQSAYPRFKLDAFTKTALRGLKPLEFTARTQHVANALRLHLPKDMPRALAIIREALPPPLAGDEGMFSERYWLWPLSDFVRDYGAEHWSDALETCYSLTQSFTAEFAIRPLLVAEPEATLKQLLEWTADESHHVRRLCSEGPRPRLPWASRLDLPRAPVFKILTALKSDPSKYVQKSVANHLNDIGKEDSAWLLDAMDKWHRRANKNTRWVINHALRTHIKDGDRKALALIGYGPAKLTKVELSLSAKKVPIGGKLVASLYLKSKGNRDQSLLIDWVMHYARSGAGKSRKVFKGKSVALATGESFVWDKSFDMTPRRTRTLYTGQHRLEVQVNGEVLAGANFALTDPS